MNDVKPNTKSRLRLKPTKKWTEREEKLLIEFLLQNKMDFEIPKFRIYSGPLISKNIEQIKIREGYWSPTAQMYYRRFCYEKKLAIEWQLVRSKVRNMRCSYAKTKSVLESIGGDIKSDNQTVRKCNYYNELDMIFSQLYLESSNNSWEQSKIRFKKNSIVDTDDSTTAVSERSDIDMLPTSSTAANRNGDFNRASVSGLIKSEESICLSEPSLLSVLEDDIDIDVSTRNKELSIEERKLALEEKKLQLKEKKVDSDEKIKIYKINSREKLKIIELEMHERLALEELKLKYNK